MPEFRKKQGAGRGRGPKLRSRIRDSLQSSFQSFRFLRTTSFVFSLDTDNILPCPKVYVLVLANRIFNLLNLQFLLIFQLSLGLHTHSSLLFTTIELILASNFKEHITFKCKNIFPKSLPTNDPCHAFWYSATESDKRG